MKLQKRARLTLAACMVLFALLAAAGFFVYRFFINPANNKALAGKSPAENHYWQGVAFYKASNYRLAIGALKEAVAADPHLENAYKKLIDCYLESQTLNDGEKYFAELAAKHPENAYPVFALGAVQAEQKMYEPAIASYKQSIQRQPRFVAVYAKLVAVYQAITKPDEAQKFMTALTQSDSANPFARYGLALAHAQQAKWEPALENLQLAIALKPDFLEAYKRRLLIFRDTGKYEEALQSGQPALKIASAKNDFERRADLLVDLSGVHYKLGENQRALDSLHAALLLARQVGNRYLESSALNTLGMIYRSTGEFQQALQHLRTALAIDRARRDREGEGVILLNLGDVYTETAAYDSALYYYEQSLKLAEEARDRRTQGAIYSSMATVHFYRADYQQANAYGDSSLQICRAFEDKSGEANELGNLASSYIYLDDYPQALNYLQEALALSRELEDQYHQNIHLGTIGEVYTLLGDYARAEISLKEAQKIAHTIDDKTSEATWTAALGILHLTKDDTALAVKQLEKALDIFIAAGTKREEALTYANLATIYTQQGRYELAATNFEKAKHIHHEIGNRYGEAETQNGLGLLNNKSGAFAKALALHQTALLEGEKLLAPKIIAEAKFGLGQAYEGLEKFPEALSHYQQAVEALESVRARLILEKQKSSFLAGKHEMYAHLIDLLCNMSNRQPQDQFDAIAFNYVERAKARALLDLLAEAKLDLSAGLPPDLQAQQKALFAKMAKISEDSLTANQKESLATELQKTEEKLEQLRLAVRQKNPAYAELQYPVPITLPLIQQNVLRDNNVLLEYALGTEASYLWAITKTQRRIFHLLPAPAIRKKVGEYLDLIGDAAKADTVYRAASRVLYRLLLEPASDFLKANVNLIIVPDDTLHYLPFEALIVTPEKQPPCYLVETHTVSYAPSASVLAFLQKPSQPRQSPEQKDWLALGDPIFGKNESADLNRSLYRQRGFDLVSLPNSGVEIQKIAAMFPANKRTTYVRAEAKEERVKRERLDQYRMLHFATHAWVDENLPGRSCIVLAIDDDPAEDGFLLMNEIFNLKLQADLVVLSACQTGRGKLLRGEGLIGLSRAFFYAGARSLLASLWAVEDRTTAELMVKFYEYLRQGRSKSEALCLAKRALIKGKIAAARHPHFWAPFVLLGEN